MLVAGDGGDAKTTSGVRKVISAGMDGADHAVACIPPLEQPEVSGQLDAELPLVAAGKERAEEHAAQEAAEAGEGESAEDFASLDEELFGPD